MYRKTVNGKYGSFTKYGHTDFRTGGCDFETQEAGDLLRKEHLPAPELTDRQKENKAKLAGIIGGLFKK